MNHQSSFVLLVALALCVTSARGDDRPNILWISCEDISTHLGCYGDEQATTPNLDRLAEQGVRFTQAHHCHGVCAPARTGIITAMWPTTLGVNHMRCKGRLPEHVKPFPHYLRQAGYYCTNNSKTDYNFHWKKNEVWDESSRQAHWKNRPNEETPFFAVFNFTMTHESRIWPHNYQNVAKHLPEEKRHDPATMSLPAFHPPTATSRQAMARLYDLITVMDQRAGQLLAELDQAGLADDTIVFFWSDHGDGLPRMKRWVYDSGTRVPLLLRIPRRFRESGQGEPGRVDDELLSMIDLGPTVLRLASVEIPAYMHGRPFLGEELPERRDYVYGARDRIDERYDLVRAVRDGRYRYMRNYMPWRPTLQVLEYAERNSIRQEMRKLHRAGELPDQMADYLEPPRPVEELYDLRADPDEVNNLADDPAYAKVLTRMRRLLAKQLDQHPEPMFLPEPMLVDMETELGSRWAIAEGPAGHDRVATVQQMAELASNATAADIGGLTDALDSYDPAIRWWAAMGLGNLGAEARPSLDKLRAHLEDRSAAVRVAAARALDLMGDTEAALPVLTAALQDENAYVRLWAIDTLDEMDERAAPAIETILAAREDRVKYISRIASHIASQF